MISSLPLDVSRGALPRRRKRSVNISVLLFVTTPVLSVAIARHSAQVGEGVVYRSSVVVTPKSLVLPYALAVTPILKLPVAEVLV